MKIFFENISETSWYSCSYLGKFEKIFLKTLEIFKNKTIQKAPAIQYIHTSDVQ